MKLLALLGMLAWTAGAAAQAAVVTGDAKGVYQKARENAAVQYKSTRAACNKVNGYLKDVCVAEANAARVRVEAEATAAYKNTLKAHTKARIDIAEAEYEVAKARCGNQAGNGKDVCIKLAKATRVAAIADANADKKAIDARAEAAGAKRDAEYKLALQRCDAAGGATRQACVAQAKAQFAR